MWSWAMGMLADLGRNLLFLKEVGSLGLRRGVSGHLVAQQIWKVSLQSMPTTALAGFFVGAIMTIQFTLQIRQFGALGYLGGLSTSGTIRELGPLLIAFMLSGKVGAFTSAELATMRVTEQIDAIRCLGADPLREIILPRLIAIVISSFFLLALGLVASVGGGILLGYIFAGINPEEYLRHIPTLVSLSSVFMGLMKCFVFALLLAAVCTYRGYTASGGARGVGRAVVSTAVITMVGIVVADFFTSILGEAMMSLLRRT